MGGNFNSSDDPSCPFEIVSMQRCVIVPTETQDSDPVPLLKFDTYSHAQNCALWSSLTLTHD